MAKQMKLSDQVRKALRGCGRSMYSICQATGIDKATVSRFVHGKGVTLATLDLLANALDLELQSAKKKGKVARG